MMASVDHPRFKISAVYPDGSHQTVVWRRNSEEEAERARRTLAKMHPKAIVKVRKER